MVPTLPGGAMRLAAVLDALPDGLVLVHRNGTVVNANTSALAMFEAPGTTLLGRGLVDLLPTLDPRPFPDALRNRGPAGEWRRTAPVRTIARRTNGDRFPVEVSESVLARPEAYDADTHHTGGELLMLIVRDLTGTLDAAAEPARSQRQTEMILRAVSEGVVGTDAQGRVVLVNPAFTEILGYRATELEGVELHPLIVCRRADGSPFPFAESPLADTLRSGRKHRVRGQVLWSKAGDRIPVDLTTAPVRDGDQLVGAIMTFTDRRPYEELIARHEAELEERAQRYATLARQYAELTGAHTEAGVHRVPRPDANPRLTATGQQSRRRESAATTVTRHPTTLGTIVNAGIDKASALTGPHRTQFAVHAPPVVVALDPAHASTALAHLIADASGVTTAGSALPQDRGALRGDTTVIITAALRGDHLSIEIAGPRAANDPAHLVVARRIIDAHDGALTVREHPGDSGLTYVIRIPHGLTPQPTPAAPYLAHSRPAQAERTPVGGSWIIGAAVGAHRDRTAARSRPYALPAESASRARSGGDETAEQRIVDLLARIRGQSA
ncbi:PAS domain-containing protein [Streptomyces sp. NPDC096319]|uniref:PAS domain-containing sensor histidine kinase n=1 Tax=Streptomyces sp. NPDC096319 TaxID=3366084 RepID=UPI003828FB10